MRVTLPIDVWDPRRGGTERYLDRLARALVAAGVSVRILCLTVAPDVAPDALPGLEIETLSVPRFPRALRELRFARAALRRHQESGGDVLFAVRHALEADVYQPHGGSYRAAKAASLAASAAWVRPWKRAARAVNPRHRVLLWLDREVFRRSPNLVTVSLSELVETGFRESYPELAFRFERLPNGVSLERFHDRDRAVRTAELRERLGVAAGERVALFLGHAFRQKGLGELLEALGRLEGWHVWVGGRGPVRRYARRARRAKLGRRVHFAGELGDPRAALAGSDAFVLPTWFDPCSLSVLEALACGTPVVTTRQNGAGELIEDGREGHVLESPRAIDALTGALRRIDAGWDAYHAAASERARALSEADNLARMIALLAGRL